MDKNLIAFLSLIVITFGYFAIKNLMNPRISPKLNDAMLKLITNSENNPDYGEIYRKAVIARRQIDKTLEKQEKIFYVSSLVVIVLITILENFNSPHNFYIILMLSSIITLMLLRIIILNIKREKLNDIVCDEILKN